ncbi:unnamed protein product [Mycena citricolor]|uniref:Uncharacterized protein n=1 Tax=Mycena citricolor TaxID=2018698 RepID=A0AAD2HNL2_9AGAR|nr:unnamed protein product [Mycena citricolor]CAK5279268.1 unnamed protein product [Mycena citricolor]CAK5280995.1 unnamed protein product [Mycena citricolor]
MMSTTTSKRKPSSLQTATDSASNKRIRLVDAQGRSVAVRVTPPPDPPTRPSTMPPADPPRQRPRMNRLTPARPFPTVPRSVSATGPRSAHKEGKNLICITRKTPLSAYLRRCKNAVINDGYKTLHLSAMGAAIPHLLQLSVALPPILPFAADEIQTHVTTGTMEVQDEIIPDDEDEDIEYKTRGKSTLAIVIKIGDGEFEGDKTGPIKRGGPVSRSRNRNAPRPTAGPSNSKSRPETTASGRLVLPEPDQDEMDETV